MSRMKVREDYFDWMFDLVCEGRFARTISYRKLLSYLHDVEFTCRIKNDVDRACDGVNLRHRFALLSGDYDYVRNSLNGPCSVLEMIVALAIRCEEQIMNDPMMGDRTGQWFWKMIVNLGLGGEMDDRYDEQYVEDVIDKFLNRTYQPDGHGGLFVIRGCRRDLRHVSIWDQMMWFLDTMI